MNDAALPPSRWLRLSFIVAVAVPIALVPFALKPASGSQTVTLQCLDLLAFVGGLLVNTAFHELGHLVAAKLLGLPVLGMRLFGRRVFGHSRTVRSTALRNAVLVDIARPTRLLAVKMVVFAFAGPTANLLVAWVAFVLWSDPNQPMLVRGASASVGIISLVIGLANLLPFQIAASQHSDGGTILRWATASADRHSELAQRRLLLGFPRPGSKDEATKLRAAAESQPAAVAGPAAHRLLAAVTRDARGARAKALWAEAPLMIRVGRMRGVDPGIIIECCSRLSFVLSVESIHALLRNGLRPSSDQLAIIVELAETGKRVAPDSVQALYALALARALEGRAAEARSLLVTLPLHDQAAETVARVHAIRAMAEVDLRNLAQADRLVASAERQASKELIVQFARLHLDAADGSGAESRPEQEPGAELTANP